MITAEMPEPTKAFILLTELEVQGKLHDAIREGIISARHQKYLNIYNAYKRETSRFKTKCMKIASVCDLFKVSHMEVYRAINFMER